MILSSTFFKNYEEGTWEKAFVKIVFKTSNAVKVLKLNDLRKGLESPFPTLSGNFFYFTFVDFESGFKLAGFNVPEDKLASRKLGL